MAGQGDTPELGRLVVLHGALFAHLLDAAQIDRNELELKPILKEIDALTMRIAHRSRSAIGYDGTLRGRAALADAAQVAVALADDATAHWVELEHYVWSQEQLNGPIMPGMQPERRIVTRQFVAGMKLLSDDFQSPLEEK